MTAKLVKSQSDWKQQLTDEQYQITRKKGTERAFSGEYWTTKDKGAYRCVCCGQSLFHSSAKYDSGTGWPSFFQPTDKENVILREDADGTERVEVACSRCDAHLGHLFEDGPLPTGLRFCINSAALRLDTKE